MGQIIYALWGFVLGLDMGIADGDWGTMTFGLYDDGEDMPLLVAAPIFLFNGGAMCYAALVVVGIFVDLPIRGIERVYAIFKRGLQAEKDDKK